MGGMNVSNGGVDYGRFRRSTDLREVGRSAARSCVSEEWKRDSRKRENLRGNGH
jgi:hypothetical protein